MKKTIFSLLVLATSLAACTDDYKDWAEPQHNDQPATVQFGNGSVTEVGVIDLGQVFDETVQVAQVTAPTSSDAAYADATYRLVLEGKKSFDIALDAKISYDELQKYVVANYGKEPAERDLDAVVEQFPSNGSTAVKVTSGTFKVKVIPQAADIDRSGYYLVGSALGGWDKAHAVMLDHSETNFWDDPNFELVFTSLQAGKVGLVKASQIDESDLESVAYGIVDGKLVQGETVTIAEADKKYVFSFNAESNSASCGLAPMDIFMTGSNYGWGSGENAWLQFTPTWDGDMYWKIIYLHADEQFKFAPVADWKDDFGFGGTTINDAAGAGIVDEGGNLKATNAGWYLIVVTYKSKTDRAVSILEPNVYLQGATTAQGWNVTGAVEANKFTVPTTEDGEFVSPAFVKGDEIRMSLALDGLDWWKTEFFVNNGSILYRGRGGDDVNTHVSVEAGKQAHINFTTGAIEIK
jgi:hypothetical protein